MENRCETRDAWLHAQEQLRHDHIVTVNQALALTPSLYFGTRRVTYSDVLSVVTTAKPVPRFRADAARTPTSTANKKVTAPPAFAHAKHAWGETAGASLSSSSPTKQSLDRDAELLPFTHTGNGAAQYVQAPLEGDSERKKRFRMRQSLALAQERTVFVATLHAQRRQRFQLEQHAALVIQRVYRGFLLRRRFRSIKEKLRVRKRIRVNLVKVTKGTAIITGEKDRKARVLARRDGAARKIQFCFRRWCGRWLVQRERVLHWQERRHGRATRIQRAWRRAVARAVVWKLRERLVEQRQQRLARLVERLFMGYQARQRVRRIRLRRELRASHAIQNAVRRVLARKALTLRRRHTHEIRRSRAATTIQRLARGVLARGRVWRIRVDEDRAIRAACVLQIQRVFRGFLGRRRMRFHRVFHAQSTAWTCALHTTRVVRGFLARRHAAYERLDQEADLLVQTVKGNTSTVIDLLDGFGPVDAPVDLATTNFDTGNSVLHLAAKHGRMEILTHVLPKCLAHAPAMVYEANRKGETPLELAIRGGHEMLASFLLTKTAELFVQQAHASGQYKRVVCGGRRERSLVLEAARSAMGVVAAKLVVLFPQFFNGKERDAWSQRTVLHEVLLFPRERHYEDATTAAVHTEAVLATLHTLLTKFPVDVDAQDVVGFTPLHLAAMGGQLKAVKLLLEFGADVAVADKEGRSAWRLALLHGHEACFLEIRRKWLSDVSISKSSTSETNDGARTLETMGKALADAATKGRRAGSASPTANLQPHLAGELVRAARRGDFDKVRFYLEELHAGANACDPQGDGDSLLMVVLSEKNVKLLRYLLATHADELALAYVNKAGWSVMDAALQSPRLIKMLIHEGGANVCLPLDTGKRHRSAVHEAVRRGFDLRDWLRGYALMPSMLLPLVDDAGRSPLHDAAAFGNVASAALLLHAGLRVDQQDAETRRTPLHEACRSGSLSLVRKMVRRCPDALWVRDAARQLPLLDAAWSGSLAVLDFVIDAMRRTRGSVVERSEAFAALEDLVCAARATLRGDEGPVEVGAVLQRAFELQP